MNVLEQIASEVGVSARTVLNVLNGRNKETWPSAAKRAAHIRAIAAKLNYRPNASARAIRTGRFNALGFVMRSDMAFLPYQLLRGVTETVDHHDLHLSLARLPFQAVADSRRAPKLLRELSVDGLLMHEAMNIPRHVIELLRQSGAPTVWLNAKEDADSIYPDEVQGVRLATGHLLGLGHRRIAYLSFTVEWVSGTAPHYSLADRKAGYIEAMSAAGLGVRTLEAMYPRHHRRDDRARPGDPDLMSPWGKVEDDRVSRVLALLRRPDRPTAVVCESVHAATAVLEASARLGWDLPRDLSVVVVHHEEFDFFSRDLSVAQLPMRQVGYAGVEMLVRKLAAGDPDEPVPSVSVPYDCPTEGTLAPPPPDAAARSRAGEGSDSASDTSAISSRVAPKPGVHP